MRASVMVPPQQNSKKNGYTNRKEEDLVAEAVGAMDYEGGVGDQPPLPQPLRIVAIPGDSKRNEFVA